MDPVESELQKLLAAGKCKQAVELAKDHHKKIGTAGSQQLLVQAYVARIEQFQSKGMGQEAQTLITLIQQRFPTERRQLLALEIRALADAGKIDELLRPLAFEQTSPEIRTLIEQILARNVTDLPAVAASESLPADHPLRVGAAAVWKAFAAVTSGPVSDEAIQLPEISRRSPFAAWKMFIRAIAAFYAGNDVACQRALEQIPADSVVAASANAVRSLVEGKKPLRASHQRFTLGCELMMNPCAGHYTKLRLLLIVSIWDGYWRAFAMQYGCAPALGLNFSSDCGSTFPSPACCVKFR